jgi:D-alanyl-lipoteichoic acid acyltransferase DltB (MBOAT superfamily)
MPLSDPLYFLFLLGVFLLFYALAPGAPRRVLLLIASYYFYFRLSGAYAVVLLFVTGVTFFGARALRKPELQKLGDAFFALLVIVILAPLLAFKYLGPFLQVVGGFVTALHGPESALANLAVPIGISFFTFVAIGYLYDVYLEVIDPEESAVRFSLLLAFFPLITAGPIERGTFLSQFDLNARFSSANVLTGLRLILTGLVLKVIFADALSVPVNAVFDDPAKWSPLGRLIGVFDFAYFIYSDFAGYTLIALGSAKLLGLEVRPNFTQPFLSATLPEFWRCWHISLSTWVRDYIFSPLRARWRREKWGMSVALFLSIFIIGVWHGAKWGYAVFGIMHATVMIISSFTLVKRDAFWKKVDMPPPLLYGIRLVVTFSFVLMTYIFFRADTIHDAIVMYQGIFSPGLFQDIGQAFTGTPTADLLLFPTTPWIYILIVIAGDILARKKLLLKFPQAVQYIAYAVAVIMITAAWMDHYVAQTFVYNKF